MVENTPTSAGTSPLVTKPRRWAPRAIERAYGRKLGLRPATHRYGAATSIAVPMRDGVELMTDVYLPEGTAHGTILVRCPYGRSTPYSTFFVRQFVSRGYQVVLQSCRGTFGSGSPFEPVIHEKDDSADALSWMRGQPWYTGRLATIGLSYLGFTQWALLMDPPEELVTSVVLVAPHDFSRVVHGSGALSLHGLFFWSDTIVHQERAGFVRGTARMVTADKRLAAPLAEMPLLAAAERYFGTSAPWYSDWTAHPDLDDEFWHPYRLTAALDRVRTPVHLIGGWHDLFLDQAVDQFAHLNGRGHDVTLTLGPWTHLETLGSGAAEITRETLERLDHHFGVVDRRPGAPVRVFVTGQGAWRDVATWPPPASDQTLHLHPGGRLANEGPAAESAVETFVFDPHDPTPTIGGRIFSVHGGRRDDSALADRDDVLAFTSDPLEAEVDIMGTPVLRLEHATDNPHADLFVRISEVDAKGRSRNVTDGFVRLDPAGSGGTITIELDPTAHRFSRGSRMRLLVAGGSHPRFDRNLGTGDDPCRSAVTRPSHRTVTLAGSRLVLPVVTSPSS